MMQRLPAAAARALLAARQLQHAAAEGARQQLASHLPYQRHLSCLAAGGGSFAWRPTGSALAQQQQQEQHQHQQPQQQPPHQQQQQQRRGMAVVVDVDRNQVDRALGVLNKHWREAGMVDELRKREYRRTSAELKFAAKRAAHNKRVGVLIAERLKWVVRRRKLKM